MSCAPIPGKPTASSLLSATYSKKERGNIIVRALTYRYFIGQVATSKHFAGLMTLLGYLYQQKR